MESAGTRLKNLRLEKGLSLEEVHKKTRIHINILKAIEEDNLVNVSPVYLKGFLKIYCNFLGVQPREFIVDYKEPPVSTHYFSKAADKPDFSPKVPDFKFKGFKFQISKKTVFLAVKVVLVIVAVVLIFNFLKFLGSRRRSMPEKIKAASVQEKAHRESLAVKPLPVKRQEEPAVKPAVTGVRLIIRAKEDCYVQLKSDGHAVYQGTIKKNRFESWTAKEKIEFSLGDAGAAVLEVNGKPIPSLGRRRQSVKNILINKEGLISIQ